MKRSEHIARVFAGVVVVLICAIVLGLLIGATVWVWQVVV